MYAEDVVDCIRVECPSGSVVCVSLREER